jgi:hypothetical protein
MAAPTINPLAIVEDYAALTILRESQLNDAMSSIQTYVNAEMRLNLVQLATDVFGDYTFNNDGIATVVPALVDQVAFLAEDETVTGAWTFEDETDFEAPVNSTSTFSSSGQMRCRAYVSGASQVIADNAITSVALNGETYDVGVMHNTVVNNSRFTIPNGGSGVYLITGQATFDVNATGRRQTFIYKNGSLISATTVMATDFAADEVVIQVTAQDIAADGDFYEMRVYQNSGGNLDLLFGEFSTFLSALKVW